MQISQPISLIYTYTISTLLLSIYLHIFMLYLNKKTSILSEIDVFDNNSQAFLNTNLIRKVKC